MTDHADQMWENAALLTRVLASSVKVAEMAGQVIKQVTASADLKIVDKSTDGQRDLQTEADRAAQFCIEKSLQTKFANQLNIIGEEEVTSEVPNLELGVSAEVLAQNAKCPPELRDIYIDDLVIWVDPLDGTSEFADAVKTNADKLRQVTVLIGITHKGMTVAGVIHQPFYNGQQGRTVWGMQGVGTFGHNPPAESGQKVVVTTRSHFTPLVQSALTALEKEGLSERVEKVGGAGYKVIQCLEGATAYVFASGGCKKWDTAAPEACLAAAGGRLTDVSGRSLYYGADAQRLNSGGVLATAPGVDHDAYVKAIPHDLKKELPEFVHPLSKV